MSPLDSERGAQARAKRRGDGSAASKEVAATNGESGKRKASLEGERGTSRRRALRCPLVMLFTQILNRFAKKENKTAQKVNEYSGPS